MPNQARNLLVTGGCGFIGSNFIRLLLAGDDDVRVVNLDALTYAGNLENLAGVDDDPRYRFVRGDIGLAEDVEGAIAGGVDAILNFAAESHVDRSIHDSGVFVRTNVVGTQVLLEAARRHRVGLFLQVGTDEVYGDLGDDGGFFTEATPIAPSSPYSASKAAADLLVQSYHRTHGLPTIITRSSNNYGPYQFPEKLIPLMITNARAGHRLPVYGDGRNVRDWIHVEDHCRALRRVLEDGAPGSVYNIGARCQRTNLEIVRSLLAALDRPEDLIEFVADRPGHDRRYAIDPSRLENELGFRPLHDFETGLARTIEWYLENEPWAERIRSGEFRSYYETQYPTLG